MGDYWQIVLPCVGILVAVLVLYRAGGDVRPIFVNVVQGVAKNTQNNATQYAIAIMFGLSASLSAFYDAFQGMSSKALTELSWHQYAALWTKVLNPFIVAVLAYATQNNFKSGPLALPAAVVSEQHKTS